MSDRGGGSNLHKIHRNRARIEELSPPLGTVIFRSAADIERLYPAVGTVHTLDPDRNYIFRGVINMTPNTFKAHNVYFIADSSPLTFVFTNSPNPLIESDGPGYINIIDCALRNTGGPIVNVDLGSDPIFAVFRIIGSIFFGGRATGGTGSFGTITSADRVTIDGCFFIDMDDGMIIDGVVNEISMTNSALGTALGATGFTGVEITDDAEVDIVLFSTVRFETAQSTDRAMKIGTGATYVRAVQIQGCSLRGPAAAFLDAAGKLKSDPFVMSVGNGEALADSVFAGIATFSGNTVETVIGGGNQGVLLPIGSGAPTHEVFDGGAFTERWSLSGATTQVQKFTNDDLVTRTYDIEIHCQLNRAGGGTVFIGLGIIADGVLHAPSVTAVEVGNAATGGYATATLTVAPTKSIELRMSNNTNEANVIMNSATWKVKRV